MFDKLEDLLARYESVLEQLSDQDVLNNQEKYTALMKEQSELAPIADKYKEYLAAKQAIEDSLLMLEEEKDEVFNFVGFVTNENDDVLAVFPKKYNVVNVESDLRMVFDCIKEPH